jgi:hypothetical protein
MLDDIHILDKLLGTKAKFAFEVLYKLHNTLIPMLYDHLHIKAK